MAYTGYTQARNKASQKYNKTHLEQIAIRVKKGTRDRWHEAAQLAGESYAQFIMNAVEDRIKNLSLETPSENISPETPSDNPIRL